MSPSGGSSTRSLAGALTAAVLGLLVGSQIAFGQELQTRNMVSGQSGGSTLASESPQLQDAQTSKSLAEPLPQLETNSDNISSVLLMLGTSPERRQLATELEHLLQQGKFEAAEGRLYRAIEIGSLAVLLADRFRDPKFLKRLQELGSKGEERHPPPLIAADNPTMLPMDSPNHEHPQPHATNLSELKQAKGREQHRADAIARELATANEELHALRTLREREASSVTDMLRQLTKLKAAIEWEREQADAATRELVAVSEEHRAIQTMREQDSTLLASSRKEVSELRVELEKERQRNDSNTAAVLKKKQPGETGVRGPKQTGGTAGL
jgi:hypothetical protein